MERRIIPGPLGLPFSNAVLCNGILEVSGQIGMKDGTLMEGIDAQTGQALRNTEKILKEAGLTLKNVTKARIYLTSMEDYAAMNEAYAKSFPKDPPARVALAVKGLPLGALVEIECTAAKD